MTPSTPASDTFLRFKKLKGKHSVLAACKHNLRELPQADHIDAQRSHLNQILCGPASAQEGADHYHATLAAAGVRFTRKDAVHLVEAIVSLPTSIRDPDNLYFGPCLRWFQQEFGSQNILSAIVHADEAAHHLHVLLIPLVDGRLRGSDMVGGPRHLRARRLRFNATLLPHWQALGAANPAASATAHPSHQDMARAVIGALRRQHDPILRSALWPQFRSNIEAQPRPYFEALGCPAPMPVSMETAGLETNHNEQPPQTARRSRPSRIRRQPTLADIFTRPVKGMRGARAERYRQSLEYRQAHAVANLTTSSPGLGQSQTQSQSQSLSERHRPASCKSRTLCSVGFVAQEPTTAPAEQRSPPSTATPAKPTPGAIEGLHLPKPQEAPPAASDNANGKGVEGQRPHQGNGHNPSRWHPPTRGP